MSDLLKLKPESLWRIFHEITQVPRPSKKEGKIIAYLEDFALKNHLKYKKDEVGNIVILKEATAGYENRKTIVLQSHMDMVCEKNTDTIFDFENDPIQAYVDGDWVKAKGTTLGADDGIGMAAALAVLVDEILEHGKIECLFTVDEETGLSGAFALKPGFVEGKILINLDSEDWGEIFIGCAGGRDTKGDFPFEWKIVKPGAKAFKVQVKGLKGGHSGDDIHKGLGNSIKILNRLLWLADSKYKIMLAQIDGGNLRNAIPREAFAVVVLNDAEVGPFLADVEKIAKEVKNEYHITAPDLQLFAETCAVPEKVMDCDNMRKLFNLIYVCPHGEMAWSQTMPGLVETSTNLASVKMKDNRIEVVTSQRSSVESALDNMVNMVQSVFKLAGANYESGEGYPGWEPKLESEILKLTKSKFTNLFGEEPVVRAIHAGLECGIIGKNFEGMDMVSIGPTLRGVHSPDEKLNIPSTQKFWTLLTEILKDK